MASTWKTVRVFISSTFRDMHAERDHLIRVTFPALREKLLPHRVDLYDIDLRWGITEDEAKNEKVIDLCLEQVDDCRPFFLAFLGHRYGWVPDHIPDETKQKFPFVLQFPGVSLTELELRHGAMLDHAGSRTLILLRKGDAVASIPEATRNRDFVETDPQLKQRLESLKRELETGPYPVQPYSAVWEPERYDRVNRTEGRLDGLNDFGKQVEDWLWKAIRTELQLPENPSTVDPLDAEADLHERFQELRTRIYVGRNDLYHKLHDFAIVGGEVPLLLTGESGLGKSAALARFVRDFRKQHPDVFVLPHFVGASPRTTSLPAMLCRLTDELQREFNLTLPKANSSEEILRAFIIALTSLPESARVVLVFDALNQLDADTRANTLVWLPEKLPANVRVLCSAATGPQQAPRVLTAFGERDYVAVPLEPLTADERRDIIRAIPKLVAKTLDDEQINALLSNPATDNPLFLMVALEELRGYGSFENLNKLIARLPREGDTLTKLFVVVFNRLEKEFGTRLVEHVLSLLVCARRGLSGPELVELTRNLAEATDALYPLLRQLEPYLHRRDGRYDFYHMSIRRAVEVYYLKWEEEEDQHDPWSRWNTERNTPTNEPTELERDTRHRLIDFFETDPLSPRSVDELPWQLAQLRSWQRLFDLLGNLTFFSRAWRADQFEVRMAWSLVKTVGRLAPIEAYRGVLANPANHDRNALWQLALYLQQSGNAVAADQLWSFFIDYCRSSGNDSGLPGCLGSQALILQDIGDLDGAMRLHKEEEAICRQLNDAAGLYASLGNQALILDNTGDPVGAMRLHKEEEAICRQLNDAAGLQASLGNQAMILRATGDLDGAKSLLKEKEAICRRLNDPVGLSASLGNQAVILMDTGELGGASRLFQQQEAICRRLNDPVGLYSALGNRALILQKTGDPVGAMRLHKEEEAICRQTNAPKGLALSLANQACLLANQSQFAEALPLAEEALRVALKHGLIALARQFEPFVQEIRNLME
jgi:nephrocystin-3